MEKIELQIADQKPKTLSFIDLRDQMAMAALAGMLATKDVLELYTNNDLYERCYGIADAMLAQREKK